MNAILRIFNRHLFFLVVFTGVISASQPCSAQTRDGSATIDLNEAVHAKCLTLLRQGLKSDEFWPSIHAAEALTLGGRGAEVRSYLSPRLGDEKDAQQRCGISRELVRAGDRAKAEVMFSILRDKDDYGHVHAAESLYKVVEIGDGIALRKAVQQEGNMKLRLMAAGALGRCGNAEAMSVLRSTLSSRDDDALRIASWILGRIGGTQDVAPIRRRLSEAKDPLVRAYLSHSLAALGDPEGLKLLSLNLDSADPALRVYAATFAGDARAVGVAPKLVKLLNDSVLDVRIRAAQSLLVLSRPAPIRSQQNISSMVYPATESNPRYTEGSIIELNDGTLMYAVTEFIGDGSDFAKARIVARRSIDSGLTWGSSTVIQENTGGLNVMSTTLRRLKDPSDPMSSRIAIFYLQKNSYDDLDLFVKFSSDEAATFGKAILVTESPGYHVVNNDRITQLSSGRLLAPAASTEDVRKVNHFRSHCFISDDGGRSWRSGKTQVDYAKRGAMEPEVIEMASGRVLMIIRTQLGHIAASFSDDQGDTWSEAKSFGVRGPEAPATLRRIPSTGDLVLIWNNTFTPGAGHGGRRTPLTTAVSKDGGKTWANLRNLEEDLSRTYSYPSLTFAGHRAVMSYWVSGPGKGQLSNKFRSVPVSWFYETNK